MANGMRRCGQCGSAVPASAENCPVCDAPVHALPPPAPRRSPGGPPPAAANDREELERHLSKLRHWALSAQSLGIIVPQLPSWAIEFASRGEAPEGWREVLRGVERIAQQRIVQALEAWGQQAQTRLQRLEAYSVDSRLEREEIEDAVHAARTGDISRALSIHSQVARVVALKERHLDQAREELERTVSLLRDMEALDIPLPDEPDALASELEKELKRGRLAPIKQRLRELQAEATSVLKETIPLIVSRYGDLLVKSRAEGLRRDAEAATLARAARAYARGRLELAAHELRRLGPIGPGPRPGSGAGEPPTAGARTPGRPPPSSGGGASPPP